MQSPPRHESLLAALRRLADGDGTVGYADVISTLLFDPHAGYYREARQRVGRAAETDFYTAASLGRTFGEMVAEATSNLVGAGAGQFTFVEIGAEPDQSVLAGVAHPFREARTLRLGDAVALDGKLVVFANEVLDAQPFQRFRFVDGCWNERRVAVTGEVLEEVVRPLAEPLPGFPTEAVEGYEIDLPTGATATLLSWLRQPWEGLFVTFDYGLSWQSLVQERPWGTARAYHRHTQSADLLQRPGEQDVTCHLCWDHLAAALSAEGFSDVRLDRQEAFLVRNAPATIRRIFSRAPGQLSEELQRLKALLHPQHFGTKFQVLSGWRESGRANMDLPATPDS